jgi:hypothetical protein
MGITSCGRTQVGPRQHHMEKTVPDIKPETVPPATVVANAPTQLAIRKAAQSLASGPINRPHPPNPVSQRNPSRLQGTFEKVTDRREKHHEPSTCLTVADNPSEQATSEEAAQMKQIASLWSSKQANASKLRLSREELTSIRNDLSKRLYEFKSHLSRNARGGKWAQFLRAAEIPLATADRYAKKWEVSLTPLEKLLSEELFEATTATITKLIAQLKPKLVRTLTTEQSVTEFMVALATCLKDAIAQAYPS